MKKIILSTIITIGAFFAFSAPKTQKLIVDKITTQHFNLHNIKKDNIDANGVINYSVKKIIGLLISSIPKKVC